MPAFYSWKGAELLAKGRKGCSEEVPSLQGKGRGLTGQNPPPRGWHVPRERVSSLLPRRVFLPG